MASKNLGFVFPGQGSQKVGMLADLASSYSTVEKTFAEASAILGYDLWALAQNGPQEELALTERTQPLLLTASVATWRVWEQENAPQPGFLAGHSLGEWSALVCAGVVPFEAAVRLVQQRGKFMQEAVPKGEGGMAAIIGLSDEQVQSACEASGNGEVVTPVNFNSPGQVVIAGHAGAVERAIAASKEVGAKRALPLPVSAPFHTSLMRPAADQLASQIEAVEFQAPQIPVIHNVTAASEADPSQIKALMVEQIYKPVRWVECVEALSQQGVTTTLECGPGKVLSGLNKRINKALTTIAVETADDLRNAIEKV